MLRIELPIKIKVKAKVNIIRKADKDRMKAALKKKIEREAREETGEFGEEDRPP